MPNIFRFKSDYEVLSFAAMSTTVLLIMASLMLAIFANSITPILIAVPASFILAILSFILLDQASLNLQHDKIIVIYDKKTKEIKHVFENDDAFKSAIINPFKINIFKNSIEAIQKIEEDYVSMSIDTTESNKKLIVHVKFTKQITDFNLCVKIQNTNFKKEFIDAYNKTCNQHDFSEGNDLSASNKRMLADIIQTKYAQYGVDVSSIKIKTEVSADDWVDAQELNESNIDQPDSTTANHKKKRYISLLS